ncbi:MAG: hypothetical protein KDD33_08695 [Bdellovibrionales bacterium]|nr:hypothetical protein [Bdellovibrionales bacterium]
MAHLPIKTLTLIVVYLFTLTAEAGTITSVMRCREGGRYPQDCQKIKRPADRSCTAAATTLSNGRIGNSRFAGRFSIPAIKIIDHSFSSSIVSYQYKEVDGIARKSRWNKTQIGEWSGVSEQQKSGQLRIYIEHFYYYAGDKNHPGHYIEYHCQN